MLEALRAKPDTRGICLRLARVKSRVRDIVDRAGLADRLGEGGIQPSVRAAVETLLRSRGA